MVKRILVTGAAGFIGSHLTDYILATEAEAHVIGFDLLTYAGNLHNLREAEQTGRFILIRKADVGNPEHINRVLGEGPFDLVFNCAAETHVDRSIGKPGDFLRTNIWGIWHLLEASRRWGLLTDQGCLIHLSTDEVYGSVESCAATETWPTKPGSPYSASKVAADALCWAYYNTYGTPVRMARPSNCFGPRQYPEKFIPVMIRKAFAGEKLPLYAGGDQVRQWLYVMDAVRGVWAVARRGFNGAAYNLGGPTIMRNSEVAEQIIHLTGAATSIEVVSDRPGHDFRYCISSDLAAKVLGWAPTAAFTDRLDETIRWYRANPEWWPKDAGEVPHAERMGT